MNSTTIKGVACADLHLGIDNVGGDNPDGLPYRVQDYLRNFGQAVDWAIKEPVDLFAFAGDLFKSRNPPQRILAPVVEQFRRLQRAGIVVLIDQGNHEGDSTPGRANVIDTITCYGDDYGIFGFNRPETRAIQLAGGKPCWVIAVPWARVKHLVAEAEGLPYDQLIAAANEALHHDIALLGGLVVHDAWPTIFLGHLAFAGADRASEQWMTMGYEPTITGADLPPCDLAILGHYHWGKVLQAPMPAFYCGSMARIDFGEEGQDKMFWSFELDPSLPAGQRCTSLVPHLLDDRPFKTLHYTVVPSCPAESINVGFQLFLGENDVAGAVVRCRIDFATADQAAAFDQLAAERALDAAGAWWVAGIERNAPQADRRWEGADVAGAPPAEILRAYLAQSEPDEQRRGRLQDEGLALIGAGQQ